MSTVTEMSEEVVEPPVGQYDDFIDQRLERTSFHLKTLDLVTGLILVGLVLFGSLFTLVVVDHWIVGLGVVARSIALLAIVASTLYVGIKRVLLPLVKSINPEYAALTVEHAHPELKNGLINFLFFRDRPDQIRQGVLQGIQEQAAADLTSVPIDSAIDRSPIIKLGYALVALAVVWVGYILLSPKNPMQTLQRVAMPWRDIARPSQVDILEVTPGSIEIYRGQDVEVKVKVEGLKADDAPSIVFSTLDGQLVNQRIPLTAGEISSRFLGMLTMGSQGIQQDLTYRIQAGDALSQSFDVHVTEAPHIVVDRLRFDYPAYTGQADEIVQGEGDIKAIEGTRITVVGKSNQPIQRGHIKFVSSDETARAPKRAAFKVVGESRTEAEVGFGLRMNTERTASLYNAYQLNFTSETGQPSVDPIEHSIETIPDLRPVVQILTPDTRTIELPENSWQKLEVRAVDPDFKLTRVQLAARTRGRNLFRKNLLATTRSSEWHTGQFTATFRFVPRDYGLKAGDVVEYLAMGEDNRHAMNQSQLDPNRTITAKQYIRIIEADPLANEPNDQAPEGSAERSEDQQDPQKDPNQQSPNEKKSGDNEGKQSEPQEQQSEGGEEQKQDGEKGTESESGDEGEESGESQGGESGLSQDAQSGGESQDESEGGAPGESEESPSEEQSQGESNGDKQGNPSGENQGADSSESNGDDSGQNTGEPGENQNGGGDQQGENGAGEEGGPMDDEPLPSSGERDGEVVERIREHMKKKGELEEYEQNQEQNNEQQNGDSQADDNGESGAGDQTEESKGQSAGDSADSNEGAGASDTEQPEGQRSDDPDANSDPRGDGETQGSEQGDEAGSKQGSEQRPGQGDKREPGEGGGNEKEPSEQNSGDGESGTEKGEQESGNPSSDATDQSESGGSESSESSDARDSTGKADPSENASGEQSNGESTDPSESETGDPSEDGQESGDAGDSQTDDDKQGDASKPNEKADGTSDPAKSSDKQDQSEGTNNTPSDQSSDSPSESGESKGKGKPSSSDNKSSKPSKPTGNAEAGQGEMGDDTDPNDAATGDDANLEHARKATDLVLEYLRDQKQQPDQELLDNLGWKQEDVDKFVRRWDKMKREAKGVDPASNQKKSKLDELLKGMGLESPTAKVRRQGDQNDRQRDNRNTGRKRKVPSEWLDPFRAFQRGLQQNN